MVNYKKYLYKKFKCGYCGNMVILEDCKKEIEGNYIIVYCEVCNAIIHQARIHITKPGKRLMKRLR